MCQPHVWAHRSTPCPFLSEHEEAEFPRIPVGWLRSGLVIGIMEVDRRRPCGFSCPSCTRLKCSSWVLTAPSSWLQSPVDRPISSSFHGDPVSGFLQYHLFFVTSIPGMVVTSAAANFWITSTPPSSYLCFRLSRNQNTACCFLVGPELIGIPFLFLCQIFLLPLEVVEIIEDFFFKKILCHRFSFQGQLLLLFKSSILVCLSQHHQQNMKEIDVYELFLGTCHFYIA